MSFVASLENAQFSKYFLMLRNSSAFFVFEYEVVVFRTFNSGSIDLRTESKVSADWQLAVSKDNVSKYCPS